jgi:hypothetical protein
VNASGRRQRQAKNKYNHWAPRQRPNYKMRDALASRRHLERVKATERRIAQGKRKK